MKLKKIDTKAIFLLWLKVFYRFLAPIHMFFVVLFSLKLTDHPQKGYNHGLFVETYKLPRWLQWCNTLDDVIIPQGLYEPTVKKLYKALGVRISTWYWLGIRNVGHGMLKEYAVSVPKKYKDMAIFNKQIIDSYAVTHRLGNLVFKYHYKTYNDFYSLFGNTGVYAIPVLDIYWDDDSNLGFQEDYS